MQKTINKIVLLTLLILVLPISAFFIYQFASLNESEKEINKIYIQQLEAVIYSVNQYSEDVVSSWISDIAKIQSLDKTHYEKDFKKILDDNNSISSLFISDLNFTETMIFSRFSSEEESILKDSVKKVLVAKKPVIEKLWNYFSKGYQKIEPIGRISRDSLYVCLFPLRSEDNKNIIGGITIDPIQFIQQNLVSKISQGAGNEFVLAISADNDNRIIYSSENINESQMIIKKSLWLLPGMSLGLKMKSGTIEGLVSQRFYENIIILGLLLLILTIGIILIIYNIRKELGLAQLKSDFITNVSHELRTPLALISMYSETLALDRIKTEEKKHEYYSVIHNETNRLSKIVNSILNFSKMENESRKFNFQNCNLIEISNEVFKSYDYHIKSKGFVYTLNYADNIEEIFADNDAISESIINLIENTLKYSTDKKEFKIIINTNGEGPYWEIKDYGIGISREDQHKIFDKFYRVSSGLVHSTKGTGLGLSLVKQIMAAHNGEIIVESSLGSGSKFRLQFHQKK
jgi:signal transduction histidine kinase